MNFLSKTKKYFLAKNKVFSIKGAGFTLIETMVAITILLTTIVGPMEIASKALLSAFYAKDQITASYLAQEGIEFIRNYRDSNFMGANPLTDWPAAFLPGGACVVVPGDNVGCKFDLFKAAGTSDLSAVTIDSCGRPDPTGGTPDCGYLNYNSNTGEYSYGDHDSKQSIYSRVITVAQDPTNPDAIQVTSTVSWTGNYLYGSGKSITVKETLYNWEIK